MHPTRVHMTVPALTWSTRTVVHARLGTKERDVKLVRTFFTNKQSTDREIIVKKKQVFVYEMPSSSAEGYCLQNYVVEMFQAFCTGAISSKWCRFSSSNLPHEIW